MNLRPSGYEPDELPDCSIPRLYFYLLDLLLSIRQLSRYIVHFLWLREQDLNLRPSGYEPDELPDCSIPRLYFYLLDLLLSIRQLSRYIVHFLWLREQDLNLRPSGYEPDELPDCSIPRQKIRCWCQRFLLPPFNVVRIIHRDFTNTRATRGNISFF